MCGGQRAVSTIVSKQDSKLCPSPQSGLLFTVSHLSKWHFLFSQMLWQKPLGTVLAVFLPSRSYPRSSTIKTSTLSAAEHSLWAFAIPNSSSHSCSPDGFNMHAPGEAYRTEGTPYHCCVTAVASLLTHDEIQTRISNTWPYETYRHAHLSMALPSPIFL